MNDWLHKLLGSRWLKPPAWYLHSRLGNFTRYLIRFNQSNITYERHLRARKESVEYIESLESKTGRPIPAFPTVESLLAHGLSLVPKNEPGMILEFGVWKGHSVNFISKQTTQTVYGFDSFEGLPEVWNSDYNAGHFKLKSLPRVRKNVRLVKGWFNDSLPPFLKENRQPVAFIHIDCDIYSSTKTVLELLAPRIRGNNSSGGGGTVIIFDEFYNYPGWQLHEFKAFHELIDYNHWQFEPIGYNEVHSQFGVRITKVS
jgi:hypothetical protein